MKGKKIWITLLVVIVLGSGAFYFLRGDSSSEEGQEDPFVVAEIGTVIEKALAVGTIEPENEIEIKSKISGVVSKIFADPTLAKKLMGWEAKYSIEDMVKTSWEWQKSLSS